MKPIWIFNIIRRHHNQVIIFPTSDAYRSVDNVEKAVSDMAGVGS